MGSDRTENGIGQRGRGQTWSETGSDGGNMVRHGREWGQTGGMGFDRVKNGVGWRERGQIGSGMGLVIMSLRERTEMAEKNLLNFGIIFEEKMLYFLLNMEVDGADKGG